MSCEVYLDSNADEYEITVSGDSTCDEIEITVELEGETIPTETDPVFLAHPVYGMDATDVSNLHAPGSDAETLSTIGTLLDTAATGAPASGDSFPWVQTVGHTLKKISYGNLLTAISSVVGSEPLFTASEAATITSGDTTNWDTAYGWGDHSIAGYAASGDLLNYSTTGHTHATLYDPIGTASGEVVQHEIDYDHTLIATALQAAALDGYVSTGDNISLLTNDSGYITSGDLPDYSATYLGIGAKSADSDLLDGFDSLHFAATGDLLNYSTTGHNHDTAYDLIGSASGEVGQHEIDYDHSGFLTSTDLLDYSTTGHTHSTLYDPIGSASGAVGQHEINFVHGDYLTSGDLPDYSAVYLGINAKATDSDKLDGFDSAYFSATGHTHEYDILGAASGEVGQHEIDYLHGDFLTSGDLSSYIQNVVEDTTPQLGGDLDCQNYKAIAMACDNGETLPSDPVIGQWFLHTPTGRSILMQYNGSTWSPIISYGTMTLYVDNTDGTDDQSHGTGVDSAAFKTIQYAVDTIPGMVGGYVTININAETYSETVTIQNKNFTGSYSITLNGTLTAHATNAQESAVQGSGATQGSITDTGQFTGHANQILYSSNNDEYRIIDSVTDDAATIVGYWTAIPTGNYTIYDWGTVVTRINILNQGAVVIKNIKIDAGSTICMYVSKSTVSAYYCCFISTNTAISVHSSVFNIYYSYAQTGSTYTDGIYIQAGTTASISGTKAVGGNTDSRCITVVGGTCSFGSIPNVFDGSTGNKALYGIYCYNNGSIYCNYTYNIIRYCDTGIYCYWGGVVSGTSNHRYSNNGSNENGVAASYGYID